MTLEEIYKLEPKARLNELKRRKTELPNAIELMKDWDEKQHAVMDEKLRPKRRVMVEDEIRNEKNEVTKPAKYEFRDVNRISIPIEQDIINIHTASPLELSLKWKSKVVTNHTKVSLRFLKPYSGRIKSNSKIRGWFVHGCLNKKSLNTGILLRILNGGIRFLK